MASLDRTIADAKRPGVPLAVADDLHFDVPCSLDHQFHVNGVMPKSHFGFRSTSLILLFDVISRCDHTHTTATTAGHGLDHDRFLIFVIKSEAGFKGGVSHSAWQQRNF